MEGVDCVIVKSVKLDFGVAELRSDRILTFEPSVEVPVFQISHLKKMIPTFIEMTGGVPYLYYCDNSNFKTIADSETKAYFNNHVSEFAIAFAIKENATTTRFMFHLFRHLYRPEIPMGMFKTKEEAIKWLKSLD